MISRETAEPAFALGEQSVDAVAHEIGEKLPKLRAVNREFGSPKNTAAAGSWKDRRESASKGEGDDGDDDDDGGGGHLINN